MPPEEDKSPAPDATNDAPQPSDEDKANLIKDAKSKEAPKDEAPSDQLTDPNPKLDGEGKPIADDKDAKPSEADADKDAKPKADAKENKEGDVEDGPYYPEGLAEHLKGKDDKETINNLAKAYKGARDALAKEGKLPEKPEDYELDEQNQDLINTEDPSLPVLQNICHKHGITQEKFNGILGDLGPALMDAGVIKEPRTFDQNMEILGDGADVMVARAMTKIDQLHQQGFLSESEHKWAYDNLGDAEGINFVNKFMRGYGEKSIPVRSTPIEGTASKEELRAQAALPENTPGHPKFNKASYDKLQQDYQRAYGTSPSGTSENKSVI